MIGEYFEQAWVPAARQSQREDTRSRKPVASDKPDPELAGRE